MEINQQLPRKIITASLSGPLFAILLGLIDPNPFGGNLNSVLDWLSAFTLSVPAYLIYSFPVIFIYGITTSIISDFIASKVSNYTTKKAEIYISIILHILFGLILLWISLLASILFFITDVILRRNKVFRWIDALKSLAIPILTWVLFLAAVYVIDVFGIA